MHTVRAFALNVTDYTKPFNEEEIYFIDRLGDVFTSGVRPFNKAFNPQGQKWLQIATVSESYLIEIGCRFIGKYRDPRFTDIA